MLNLSVKPFAELSTAQLYTICQARSAVFVVEQACIYQEFDGLDPACFHVQGFVNDELAVYARIIPPTARQDGKPAIGRVLTMKNFRGQHFGRALMQQAIAFCQSHYPSLPIVISAQTYLLDFYQSLGFVAFGERYLEYGIEHIDMMLI